MVKDVNRLRDELERTPHEEEIRKSIKPDDSIEKLIKNEDIEVTRAWDQVMNMFCHKDHSRYHNLLVERELDLMFCTDAEVNAVVYHHIKKNANKLSYIGTFVTGIRNVFRAIGREMAYGDGEVLTKNSGDIGQEPLINTGNPMTSKIKDDLVIEMKAEARAAGVSITSEHHSAAVSMPVVVCLLARLLADMSVRMQKTTIPRLLTYNRAMLVILYAVLMHEGGSRFAETANELSFHDLFFVLHRRVPMLALVYMAPKTVDWVLRNNILSHFVMAMFKGKTKQEKFIRFKSMIPYPFNILDLPTLFVLSFKSILWMHDGWISKDHKIFIESKSALAAANKRFVDNTKFKGVKFTSFRYAAAEEDKTLEVVGNWTRKRMGHTNTSNTKERYARNNTRVKYDGEVDMELVNSGDEGGEGQSQIKLELKPVADMGGLIFQDDWMDVAFKDCDDPEVKSDFVKTVDMVCDFLETGNGEDALRDKFIKGHPRRKDLKIPLGMQITLPERQSTTEMREEFSADLEKIREFFVRHNDNSCDVKKTVEISSFPQIVYGNWRGLIGDDRSAPRQKRKREADVPAAAEVPVDEDEDEEELKQWKIEDVDPGDFVVVKCSSSEKNDKCSFKFGEDYVWIAKFHKWESKDQMNDAYNFNGQFLWNIQKDLSKGGFHMKRDKETIRIRSNDILDIYVDKKLTQLEKENIDMIQKQLDRS